jgi:hypothetical protein
MVSAMVDALFFILFFTFLYLPVTQDAFKAALIAAILVLMGLEAMLGAREFRLHPTTAFFAVFYVLLGLVFVGIGLINEAPGALFSTLIYVVWPIVYIIFVGRLSHPRYLLKVQRMLVIGAIAIGLTVINQLLFSLGLIPESLRIVSTENQDIVFYGGYTQMRLYAISTLVYLVPYFIAALMVGAGKKSHFVAKKWLWLALFLSLFGLFLSGRRAGLIIFVLAVPIAVVLINALPKRRKLRVTGRGLIIAAGFTVLITLLLAVLTNVLGWRLDEQLNFILSSISSSDEYVRFEQLNALISGWLRSPLWGWGLGSFTNEIIRNSDRPWTYELQYALTLFQTGLIGLTAYAVGIVWLFVKGIDMIRLDAQLGPHVIPVIVGCASFLIANATNPYLQAYGHLWTLFTLVAFVNTWLLRRNGIVVQRAAALRASMSSLDSKENRQELAGGVANRDQ